MDRLYSDLLLVKKIKWIILVCSFFIFPLVTKATHIVGGSLTYVYNGGSSYTITLKLYRDCSGAALPGTAAVLVRGYNGSVFAPTKDMTLPLVSSSFLAANLDSCAQAPNPIPCVQEGIYSLTVNNLPPNPGGYHLYFQLIARNVGITNIDATCNCIGESFYAYIPGSTYIWFEDFTLADGTNTDAGATAWTRTLGATPPGYAEVRNNLFEVQGSANAQATWTSQLISISGIPLGANISVNLSESGNIDVNDSLLVYYSLDGGPLTLFTTNGINTGNFSAATATTTGLIGTTIRVVIRARYDGSSPTSELLRFDNVLLNGNDFVSNNNPVFAQFPPLFLCVGNTFIFDHSATDTNGDSLVYSLYTPYNGDNGAGPLDPTFPGNVATFTPVTFLPGYTANNPLGGAALSLDPNTGILSGTPGITGQFVVGVKVKEYRNGVYLGDMLRDFQFNVINCPPPAQAYITAYGTTNGSLLVCSGSGLTFPNNSDVVANNWTWNFGDLTTTTDVSTLQYPTYTYPGPGTYTASMIINAGTSCADTSTAIVTVAVPPATPTAPGTTVCVGTSVTLTATAPGGTYEWFDAATGGTLLATGASYTTPVLSTTTTYYVQTTVAGCVSARRAVVVTVTPAPAAPTASGATICENTITTLTATAPGGTYQWYDAATGGTLLFTGAAYTTPVLITTTTYYVQTTVSGCAGPRTAVTVTVIPTPVVTATPSSSSICSGGSSSIALTSNVGGTTFAWTVTQSGVTGATAGSGTSIAQALTATGVTSGTVTYAITPTAAGCPGAVSNATVTVNPIPIVTAAPPSSIICSGGSSAIALTSNVAGTTFAWTVTQSGVTGATAGSGTSIAQALSATGITSGTATYAITPTAGGCPGAVSNATATVRPTPVVTATPLSSAICSGSASAINLASNVGGTTFAWTVTQSGVTGATAGSGTSIAQVLTATGIVAGTATYAITPTAGGCPGAVSNATVTVNPRPVVTATPSSSGICSGASSAITLTSNVGGTTFAWTVTQSGVTGATAGSGTSIGQALTATGAISGTATYAITPTAAGCPGIVNNATVTVNPTPIVTATPSSSSICSGSSSAINLTSNVAGTTFAWTVTQSGVSGAAAGSGASITQVLTATGAISGTATYVITPTAAGCTGAVSNATITVNPTPIVTATPSSSSICSGSSSAINLTSNVAGTTFTWTVIQSGVTGATAGSGTNISQTLTTTGAVAGTATYTITPTASSCPGTVSNATVTVNPIPAMPSASSNSPVCLSGTLNLNAVLVAGATYSWTGPNGFTSNIQNPSVAGVTAVNAGVYSVNITVNGCAGPNRNITVLVNNPPPASISPTSNSPVCTNQNINLSIAAITSATYSWTGPNGFTSTLQNPIVSVVTSAAAGTYSLVATVPGCGSSGTGTVAVTVNPTPIAPTTGPNISLCEGSTINLSANSAGATSYSWTGPDAFTSSLQNPSIAGATLAATGIYSVTASASGCTSTVGSVSVTVNPIPLPPNTGSNSPVCVGSSINLTASTVSGATYTWSGPNTFSSTLQNPAIASASLASAGTYSVSSVALACTSSVATVDVIVNTAPPAPPASGITICEGSSDTLTATAASGTFEWYDAATGGTLLSTSAGYVTPVLMVNTTYYVQNTVGGCSGPRTAVTVTTSPIPAAPTVTSSAVIVCEGTGTTLSATAPGGTYQWYDAPSAGTLLATNANYTTPALVTNTSYYVNTTIAGCTGPMTPVTVNVTPIDDPAFNYSSGTYCITGTNPTPIITSGASGTFSASPAGLTFIDVNTGSINLSASSLNTYAVTFTTNGACPDNSTVNITVTNAPDATFNYSTPFCQAGTNPLPTFNSGASAGTFSASPTGITFVDVITGEIDLTLSTPGTYTITNDIAAAGGCAAATASLSITINPGAIVNAGIDKTICEGSSAPLSGTISGSATSVVWSGGAGSFSSTTNLTTTYTPAVGETSATLVLTSDDPAGPCSFVTDTVVVLINPIPVAPSVSGTTICQGTSTTLSATAPGGTYNWYSAPTGGTLLSTGTDYTTPALTSNTTYYVQTTVLSCTSTRTAVTVTVTPTPAAPTASGISICTGGAGMLTATAPGGTYEWFDSATGGTLLATSANYSTPALTANTIYYVQTTIGGCTGPRTAVTVTVNPFPVAPTAADISVCDGNTGVVTATAPGGTYQWYDMATGGTLLATGAAYITPVLTADTSFYVQTTVAGCTGPRSAVNVTVNPIPAAPTASGTTICQGSTASLTATAPGGTYTWYSVPTGGSSLASGATYTSPVLNSATTYYVQTTVSGCASIRTAVDVTVTPRPATPTVAGATICSGSSTLLTATAPGGTYEWFDASTGGTLLATSAGYSTPVLTATTSYYVQTTIAGCTSLRAAATVTITPIDDPSFAYSSGTFCASGINPIPTITGGFTGTFSSSPAGLIFVNAGTGEINAAASLLNTYSITYTTNGPCPSSSNMNVTITDAFNAAFTYSGPYCQFASNPLPTFNAGASAGVFSAAPAGLSFVNTSSGEIDLSASAPGTYTVTNDIAASGGCAAASATSVITINPAATANAGVDQTICAGTTVTLAGSFGGSATSAIWSGGLGSFSNNANMNAVYTPDISESTATLILTTNDPLGPCANTTDTIIITINPIPAAPVAAGTTICENTSTTLTATSPGGTYDWYSAPVGGILLATGANYTTPLLSADTTYYVQTTVLACASPRTAVTVNVTPGDNSVFTYSSGTYCVTGINPTPVIAGGIPGTFSSSPAGLVFVNTSTGEINLGASTLNTYSVTFTTSGTCPTSSSVNVTVTNAPDAAFVYSAGSYCQSGTNPFPVFNPGASAGIFSSAPAGLMFANTSTGEIDLSASSAGTYTVTNDIAASGGCAAATATTIVTIDLKATVNAGSDQAICVGSTATLTGIIGGSASSVVWSGGLGTFSAGTNLTTTYTPAAGETSVVLTLSTNDPAGSCNAVSDNVVVTVSIDTSSFTYSSGTFCVTGANPLPTVFGGYTGTFSSSPAGLVFVSTSTGEINVSASALATYSISFTTNGTCPNTTGMNITITNAPDASFSFNGPFCESSTNPFPVFIPGSSAGVFSAVPAGINFVNISSGEIDLSTSAPGTYTLTNNIAASGGCAAASATSTVTINPKAIVDAGLNQAICDGSTAALTGVIGGSATSVTWSGGTGAILNATALNATYTPGTGETSVTLYLNTDDPIGPCTNVTDSLIININPIPAAPTATGTTTCEGTSDTLFAIAPGGTYEWYDATTGGNLLASGSDFITPVITTSTTYYVQTTVSGCTSIRTAVTATISPAPIVNAGTDQVVCINNVSVNLSGAVTNAGGGSWTSSGGGTFSPDSVSLNASYLSVVGDTSLGSLIFVLSSTANGVCSAVNDTMLVSFSPAPMVNAGVDKYICEGTTTVVMTGSVSGSATTGQWATTGSGTFTPNDSTLNATYQLSTADTTAGTVSLILTSTNNGGCNAVSDTVLIVITTPAFATVGNDTTVCSNTTSITISGIVNGASSQGVWTTSGNGIFSPDSSSLNAVYIPGTSDTSGTVVLTLTPINSCLNNPDSLLVTITPAPVVDAGINLFICATTNMVTLNGTVSGGTTTGLWTTTGSGLFSPTANTLNATYTLSNADTTAGSVSLILSSTNNGICNAVSDTILVVITSPASAIAGNDVSVCANNGNVVLSGTIVGSTGEGVWSTNGSGTFVPNDSVLNATYIPSAADTSAGLVQLILTPINACSVTADSLLITITPAPTSDAGIDFYACGNIAQVNLSGSINAVPTGAHWISNGTGTYNPHDSLLTATYTFGISDGNAIMFVLQTTGNGNCNAVSDTMMVYRNAAIVADFYGNNACATQSVSFSDSSGISMGAINNWYWELGNGDTSSVQNPIHSYATAGSYSVTLHVSAGVGCEDSITKTIIIHPIPAADFSIQANCENDSVRFTDISIGNIVSYSWNFGDTTTASVPNPVHLYSDSLAFIVTHVVVSDSGCVSSKTDTVNLNPLPTSNFAGVSNCVSTSVLFNDSSFVINDSISTYAWDFGDGVTSTVTNPVHVYTLPGTYTVNLVVSTVNSCRDTLSLPINVTQPITAQYTPAGGTFNSNESISFINQSIGTNVYDWNLGDGSSDQSATDINYAYSQPGTYQVQLIAGNGTCADTVTYEFVITSGSYVIPTGFTPNGDGLNDFFYVKGGPFSDYELRVFNEWGNQLFMADTQNNKWDGSYKGVNQPAGTYVYVFIGKTADGKEVKIQGEINLIR